MTESVTTDKQSPSGAFHTVGTGAPSADTRPVGDDDRSVIAVFDDLGGAQDVVERLAAAGFPVDRISIIHDRPEVIPPRTGDHVEIKAPGRIVEMRSYAGVPGAIVELDPTVSGFAHDHPDGVLLARLWLPLDAVAVIPSATP
jgi:hypothetical protein